MTAYRIDFAPVGQDFNAKPAIITADDRDELIQELAWYVNHVSRGTIGGDLNDDMRGGRLINDNEADCGTFTVTAL
jgi:hypothetical protein